MRQGQPQRAIGFYEQSLAADPAFTRCHMSLAAAYLEAGHDEAACVHLGKYLAAHPGHAVIACGGGTFCTPQNQAVMLQRGVTVWIDQPFDQVITVCDQANEACPVFFGARERLHWSFPDPSQATGTEPEQLSVYRTVRDAIRDRIERDLLSAPSSQLRT